MKNLRSRILIIAAWVIAIALIIGMLIAYSGVANERLYEDAKRNFTEVYQQVDNNFLSFMDETWNTLDDWAPYVNDLNDADTKEYLEQRKELWGYTQFFFLNENGEAKSLDGSIQTLDLGEDHYKLFNNHSPIMTELGLDTYFPETVFANIIEPNTYMGFTYQAIAITYSNEDLVEVIRTEAFEGQSIGFIIYPDGTIALSTQEGGNVFSNYLTYLKAGSNLTDEQLNELAHAWHSGKTGVQICTMNGTEYYISYQQLHYEDYVLLGVVPSSYVSGAIRGVQEMTVDVLVKVFAVILAIAFIQVFIYMRRRAKKSQAEIEYRDVLFNLLSENLDDIFVVVDAEEQKVSYITPNVDRLLGVSADKVRANLQNLLKCVEEQDQIVNNNILQSLKVNEHIDIAKEWVNQKTKQPLWFREAIYRMDIQGQDKYILILSDRTEDRRMATSLEEALAGAKNANQAKSVFLSNMSHDIRTPMNSIMGFTELLEANANDPKKVHEYIAKISASSRHLLNLINDVLDMSKIESGKTELNVEEFAFADLLEEVYTIVAPQSEAKGQTFEMRVDGTPAEYMNGDKLRINQLLINLLSNAVKYTPENGHVEFIVEDLKSNNPRYDKVRFIVKDNGIGMSEEYLKVIFDPFTRETNAHTNLIQGTGLGMAIAKNLVDLMGGAISVESKQGEGSTFTVDLKLEIADAESREAHANMADKTIKNPEILKDKNILAAEDNEMSAELLLEFLEIENANVKRVSNGQEAVDEFEASAPGTYDFILMDVQMPVMGGYDATRAIRSSAHPEAQTIPIFAMTANVFAEDVRQALDAGMNAHIPKPIDIDELKRVAEQQLNGKDPSND